MAEFTATFRDNGPFQMVLTTQDTLSAELTMHQTFTAELIEGNPFRASLATQEAFGAGFGEVIKIPQTDYFDGPYEYTPADTQQTIEIQGLAASQDITINAIPSNYGKISWNGAILTVE